MDLKGLCQKIYKLLKHSGPMDKKNMLRLIGYICIVVIILNFILFVFTHNFIVFWIIVIIIAIIAFPVMRRMRRGILK